MNRHSTLWLALFFGVVLAVSACSDDGGDGGGGGTDAGSDVGSDIVDTPDTGDDQTTSTCGDATPCRGNGDSTSEQFCDQGCCAARTVTPTCARAGQECEGGGWSTPTFFCAMPEGGGIGECLARCDTDSTSSTDDNGCPTQSWCLTSNDTVINTTTGAELDGACFEGDCNDACFAVGGDCTAADVYTCAEGTGTCYAVGNEASFCIEAGTQAEGEECSGQLSGEAGEICEPGLLCYDFTCVEPCVYGEDTKSVTCTEGECIPVFDHSGDNTPGVCGTECTEYSEGECEEGWACQANIGNFSAGVTAWTCLELSSDILVEYDGECDPEGVTNTCGEGLACIPTIEDETTGRCEQICDPTLEGTGAFATCPEGPGGTLFGEDTYVEPVAGTDYATIDAGSFATLYAAIEPEGEGASEQLVDGSANFIAGTASTVYAYIASFTAGEGDADPTLTYGLVTQVDVAAADVAPATDQARIWFSNFTDMTIDLFNMVMTQFDDAGATPDWTDVPADIVAQAVQDYWDILAIPEMEGGGLYDAYEVVVTGSDPDYDVVWYGADATAPTGTNALVRFINALGVEIWVNADPTDGVGGGAFSVADGAASDWITIDTDAFTGNLDINFQTAADSGVVITWNDEGAITATNIWTVVLWDNDSSEAAILLDGPVAAAADTDIAIRAFNASEDDGIDFWVAEPYVADLASLAAYQSDDMVPGSMGVVAFADAAVVGDGALGTVQIDTAANKIYAGGVSIDDEGDYLFGGDNIDWPATGDLADTEALVAFMNLSDESLRLEFPGAPLEICVDLGLFGLQDGQLGRCQLPCTPFPGGEFKNADGTSNGRWESNGCPHTAERAYGCLGVLVPFDNSVSYLDEGPPDLFGMCIPRVRATATGKFGDSCTGDATCNPEAFCLPETETTNVCGKLGHSLVNESDCGEDMYCSATLWQAYCLCLDPVVDGGDGAACLQADQYEQCAANNSLCMQSSQTTFNCMTVCVMGHDEETCPEGTTCSQSMFSGTPDPDWFGFCQ